MCGISGFVGSLPRASLLAMSESIKRRGPDGDGVYETDGVGFAFRRLSIIDIADGHQPMSNEDGSVWVMLNGEMYGFSILHDELLCLGYRFRTHSDTEVVIYAYMEWGEQCFSHLNGMFAIAIWDGKKRKLLLARDRLGKKPLYWTIKNGTFVFASEIKALIAAGVVDRDMDLESVSAYFLLDFVPTPKSIFKNVHKLEPASVLVWSQGRIEKTWTYWTCPQELAVPEDPATVLDVLRERIDQAVSERLISDVPLGVFLSGGIDSAVIAESASRVSQKSLKAFTIGFEMESYDERAGARSIAQALGLEYHDVVMRAGDVLGSLEDAVAVFDEPLADSSILPQLFLSKFAKRQVTVALSGDGGDELLLGYQHIRAHHVCHFLQKMPHVLLRCISYALRMVPAGSGYFSFGFKTQRFARGLMETNPWHRDIAWRGSFEKRLLNELLLSHLISADTIRFAETQLEYRATEASLDSGFWRAWSWAYLRTFLMDDVLVKVDRATMWHGLESRAPLLDQKVVSYLLSLPDSLKTGIWSGKRLFKELLIERIPMKVLDRPKHGFSVPQTTWLRGPLAGRLHEVMEPNFLQSQGMFSAETVKRLFQEQNGGRIDRRKELWSFFMFQLWFQKWMA